MTLRQTKQNFLFQALIQEIVPVWNRYEYSEEIHLNMFRKKVIHNFHKIISFSSVLNLYQLTKIIIKHKKNERRLVQILMKLKHFYHHQLQLTNKKFDPVRFYIEEKDDNSQCHYFLNYIGYTTNTLALNDCDNYFNCFC